jgi:hypothetical protein
LAARCVNITNTNHLLLSMDPHLRFNFIALFIQMGEHAASEDEKT